MKKIVATIVLVSLCVSVSLFLILKKIESVSSNDSIDYVKLSSSQQYSLIIGTSRAAEGIDPIAINKITQPVLQNKALYNFSFNLGCSPYGPSYFNCISKKLNSTTLKDSICLFLVAIDPWAVSNFRKEYQTKNTVFYEDLTFMGQIDQVYGTPNYDFLFSWFKKPLYSIFIPKTEKEKVRPLGAPFIRQHEYSNEDIAKHMASKMEFYRKEQFNKKEFSKDRYDYFERTISLLSKHGMVVIVRIPVSLEMANLEHEYAPDFSKLVTETAKKYDATYLDFFEKSGQYLSIDGNHIYGNAVTELSQDIAREINNIASLKN